MKVLVACEFSGRVRDAFIAAGHDAWSCDLLPTETPGPHFLMDVSWILDAGWDLLIAFPPCTYLCSSGLHWNKRRPERERETERSLEFVQLLLDAPIPRIALENPVGCISTRIRKPDQKIQPFQFGHPESKTTCLWLKNLPPLQETQRVSAPAWIRYDCCEDFICTLHPGKHVYDCDCPDIDDWAARKLDPYTEGGRWANQTPSGQNKLGPSPTRWMERSRTYSGIAAAMAAQWGALL